jgi:hypothetical protein
MSLILTRAPEKRSAVGHNWSAETEVIKIFDRCGLDTTRVQPLHEVLSDGGINYENVSWR